MDFKSKFPQTVYPGQLICPLLQVEELEGKEVVYKFISGQGTKVQSYSANGKTIEALTSTLFGYVRIRDEVETPEPETEKDAEAKDEDTEHDSSRTIKKIIISVVNTSKDETPLVTDDFANNLPKEGDIVLTRVTRITLQRANVEILAVENRPTPVDSGAGSNGTGIVAPGGGSGAATFSISQASSDLGETFRGIIRSQDVRTTERDRVKMMESFKPGDIVRAQVLSLGDGSNYYLTTARNDLGVVFAKSFNGAGGLMYAIDWQTMAAPLNGVTELRKCAKPF